jgi:hypothetical protein
MVALAIFGWVVLVLITLGSLFYTSRLFMLTMLMAGLGAKVDARLGAAFTIVMALITAALTTGVFVWSPFSVSVG